MRAAMEYRVYGNSGERKPCCIRRKGQNGLSLDLSPRVLVGSGLCRSTRLFEYQRLGTHRKEIDFVVDR